MPRAEVHRGDLWAVDFGEPVGREQAGRRPALVVTTDLWNEGPSGVTIVVPITTARRGLATHVEIEPGESGLADVSYAKCEDVKSVSVERLVRRLGRAEPDVMFHVARNLRFLLEL
jgi:mRNA interferase MazF